MMPSDEAAPIGVICAMPQEIEHLRAPLQLTSATERGGLCFLSGTLDSRAVVLVEGGIGKVNSAAVATLLLDRFGCGRLIISGAAGGLDPSLGIGDVVIAERMVQHDYGAAVDGAFRVFRPGETPIGVPRAPIDYLLDPAVRAAIEQALAGFTPEFSLAGQAVNRQRPPVWRLGTILSGDAFINDEATRLRLKAAYGGHAVEMEGAAVSQVAERFGAPVINVRCLSDLAGAESHVDIMSFIHAAAYEAAGVVRRLVRVL
jgi:adenosylhomocysteine nucleosidase